MTPTGPAPPGLPGSPRRGPAPRTHRTRCLKRRREPRPAAPARGGPRPETRAGTAGGGRGRGWGWRGGEGVCVGGFMQIPLFKKLPSEKVCHIPARARNPRANGITAASSPSWDGAGRRASPPPAPAATRDCGSAPVGTRSRADPRSVGAPHAGTPAVGAGPPPGPSPPSRPRWGGVAVSAFIGNWGPVFHPGSPSEAGTGWGGRETPRRPVHLFNQSLANGVI